MAKAILHLRTTPDGAWQWRDNSHDWPVWYPLAENAAEIGDYLLAVSFDRSDDWSVTTHGYDKTRSEPVWDGESPEKWPVL